MTVKFMSTLANISPRQKVFVMIGALAALFLAALDQTIVATALPKIVQEFGGLDKLSWVFTAYMLASTVTVPIYGKLSDIYGRRIFYLFAIVIFVVGSMLSGISQNMTELIIFRALQGIGAGSIFGNSFAIIGDLFTPKEQGKWSGIFGSVFGLASVIGPTLGGYLTDNVSWRWNFYVNVPVGILAFALIFFLMPKIVPHAKSKYVDYAGALALTATLVPMLLGFVWGGNQYPWASWQVIGLFVFAFVALCTFIAIERKVKEPILPLSLFQNSIFTVSMISVFITGIGMFGTIVYIPLFAQNVLGISATNSGAILTPMTFGIVVASVIAGQISSRTGKYKWLAILGAEVMTVGIFLLSQMSTSTSQLDLAIRMVITGLGLGVSFPIFNVVVQNAFEHSKIGVVTASLQTFRSIGATIGTAVMGSILNNALDSKLGNLSSDPFVQAAKRFAPQFDLSNLNANAVQGILSPQAKQQIVAKVQTLPPQVQQQALSGFSEFTNKLKDALGSSILEVFAISTLIVYVGVIVSFFLKEIPLRSHHGPAPANAEEAGELIGDEEGNMPASEEFDLTKEKSKGKA